MLCERCRTRLLSDFRFHRHASVPLAGLRCDNLIPATAYIRLYSTSSGPPAPIPPPSASAISFTNASSATPAADAPSSPTSTGSGRAASSVPVGKRLLGLSYIKNRPDPVAMDDSEY